MVTTKQTYKPIKGPSLSAKKKKHLGKQRFMSGSPSFLESMPRPGKICSTSGCKMDFTAYKS